MAGAGTPAGAPGSTSAPGAEDSRARPPTLADSARLTLKTVDPSEPRKISFISAIDGCVQYYALNPARASSANASLSPRPPSAPTDPASLARAGRDDPAHPERDSRTAFERAAADSSSRAERPALFLSLHGAAVEALNQARSYQAKTASSSTATR